MHRGLIAPIIANAVAVALIAGGAALGTYDIDPTMVCSEQLARLDEPAADVLVIGNSKTGAAIDPAYISGILSTDRSISVERLAFVSVDVTGHRLLFDEYVRNRGAPRLVVLQPQIKDEAAIKDPGHPILTARSIALEDWDEIAAVQTSAKLGAKGPVVPLWMEKDYRNLATTWIDRQVARITAALSYPRTKGIHARCKGSFKHKQSDLWPYASVDTGTMAEPADESDVAGWLADGGGYVGPAFGTETLRYEIDQNRRFIKTIRDSGADILFLTYPTGGAPSEADEFSELARELDEDIIYAPDLLSESERKLLRRSFRDRRHVNFTGTEMISRRLAKRIAERLGR